jgi:hypothetical protein
VFGRSGECWTNHRTAGGRDAAGQRKAPASPARKRPTRRRRNRPLGQRARYFDADRDRRQGRALDLQPRPLSASPADGQTVRCPCRWPSLGGPSPPSCG